MAEAIIQAVIGKAVEMAADQLFQMGSSLYHLQDNINSLKTQMTTLQSYLKDAESKKVRNHRVADLIINIRDLAEDAEDILDTYLPEFELHKTKRPFHVIKHASCIICYGTTAYNFAKKIKTIEKRAEKVQISMTNLEINREDATTGDNDDAYIKLYRKNLFLARESNVVGREKPLQTLEEKLLSGIKQCRIISVVGQGGVGKTTVAKKVYNKVKNEFQSCAMVYVSQQPKEEELIILLDDIAKQVGLSEAKRKENMRDNLYLFLRETRYIILLDDIWEEVTWDFLRSVLVTISENGSRIIVTARNDDLCRYMGGENSLVRLDTLSEDKANNLFSNLMFPESEEDCPVPQALENIGKKIVKSCGGLPLAIIVAVGMLQRRRRNLDAWEQVHASMSRGDENDDCQKVLALSYEDLPTELKPLFLCFGIFPQDREIFVTELVDLWVAEKLIQDDGSGKPVSIVEANIERLIARNLIQVSRRRVSGRIRSCQIHDLLHDLCVRVARDNNFFCMWNKLESSGLSSKVRRITSNSYSSSNNITVPQKLRSLFCFGEDTRLFNFIKTSALELKFLRFLIILLGHEEVHLPNEIGKLNSLICLRLGGNLVVPSSIRNLNRLLTLDVSGLGLNMAYIKLPASVLQRKQLRHLILSTVEIIVESSKSPRRNPTEFEVALPSLETLCVASISGFTYNWLKKFSNLKNLSMIVSDRVMTEILYDGVAFPKLEILKFRFVTSDGESYTYTDFPRLHMSGYQNLVKLHLSNGERIMVIKGSVEFPPNLVEVTLVRMNSIGDFLEGLKRLSKLAIIKLKDGSGDTLNFCGENSFPQLQVLELREVEFGGLLVDEIGMPNLYKVIYMPYPHPHPRYSHDILPKRLRNLLEFKQGLPLRRFPTLIRRQHDSFK